MPSQRITTTDFRVYRSTANSSYRHHVSRVNMAAQAVNLIPGPGAACRLISALASLTIAEQSVYWLYTKGASANNHRDIFQIQTGSK